MKTMIGYPPNSWTVLGGKRLLVPGVQILTWLDHGMQFLPGQGARWTAPKTKIDMGVIHYTGGEGDASQLFRVLKKRKLGVEYFIDRAGVVFQFCDMITTDAYHAGPVNRRSYGIEMQSYGFRKWWRNVPKKGRDRPRYIGVINGKERNFAHFTPEQTRSCIALCTAINNEMGIPNQVPTEVNGELITRTLTPGELRLFSGIAGHYHVDQRRWKSDPGPQILRDMKCHWDKS